MPLIFNVPVAVTELLSAIEPPALKIKVAPLSIAVAPVYVLAPLKVAVPPDTVKPPVPLITPE